MTRATQHLTILVALTAVRNLVPYSLPWALLAD